jgi:primosomal protein N' (replication factor Y)
VLERLETAAVDPLWQQMLEAVAQRCHTSSFQVLKTALPNGWLGHRRQSGGHGRSVLVAERLQPPPPGDSPTKRQQALLDLLEADGPKPVTQLVEQGFGRALLKTLASKQWIALTPTLLKDEAALVGSQVELQEEPPELSAQQQQALQQWQQQPEIRQWLLWGVTGSGKTEVYLRCCQHVLEQGQSVLLLTPEIGLVPQLLQCCRQRFGDRVISFHSGLSDGERIKAWRRCRQGGANVLVGTRSAIFLPMPQLGLIVLDEEHDSSYKQESPMPCYHARDVARIRMGLEGARLLFGSATPSLENWLLSQQDNAAMGLLELRDRIAARPLPPVHVVDMRQEPPPAGSPDAAAGAAGAGGGVGAAPRLQHLFELPQLR